MNGLVPSLPESCTDIEIVNDFDDSEGTEQLQLSLEFSIIITNVNVEGCPANVTILDRRTYTSLSCTANCRQESTSNENKNVKYIVRNIIIHACTYMYVMHVEAASLEKSQVHAL